MTHTNWRERYESKRDKRFNLIGRKEYTGWVITEKDAASIMNFIQAEIDKAREENNVTTNEFVRIYNMGIRDGRNKKEDPIGAWLEYQAHRELLDGLQNNK